MWGSVLFIIFVSTSGSAWADLLSIGGGDAAYVRTLVKTNASTALGLGVGEPLSPERLSLAKKEMVQIIRSLHFKGTVDKTLAIQAIRKIHASARQLKGATRAAVELPGNVLGTIRRNNLEKLLQGFISKKQFKSGKRPFADLTKESAHHQMLAFAKLSEELMDVAPAEFPTKLHQIAAKNVGQLLWMREGVRQLRVTDEIAAGFTSYYWLRVKSSSPSEAVVLRLANFASPQLENTIFGYLRKAIKTQASLVNYLNARMARIQNLSPPDQKSAFARLMQETLDLRQRHFQTARQTDVLAAMIKSVRNQLTSPARLIQEPQVLGRNLLRRLADPPVAEQGQASRALTQFLKVKSDHTGFYAELTDEAQKARAQLRERMGKGGAIRAALTDRLCTFVRKY